MNDWKTTATPIATLIVAAAAKYGFDVPVEVVLAIIGVGWMVHGWLTRDTVKAP